MKTINKDALKAQLLAAGMSEEQASGAIAASEQDANPVTDPKILAQLDEIQSTLSKGIKKGDLKIEHEDDDDGEEYEIEAEDDDAAEAEMEARAAAKGMSKAIQTGNYEGLLSDLLKTNAQLHKAIRTERRIFLAKVEKAMSNAGGAEIASLKSTIEAQGNILAEIKKGLAIPEAPRGLTSANPSPLRHPADPNPNANAQGWSHEKLVKAIKAKMEAWGSDKRDRAHEAINLLRVGSDGVTPEGVAQGLGLKLSDAE